MQNGHLAKGGWWEGVVYRMQKGGLGMYGWQVGLCHHHHHPPPRLCSVHACMCAQEGHLARRWLTHSTGCAQLLTVVKPSCPWCCVMVDCTMLNVV